MRVLVCGGRDFNENIFIWNVLYQKHCKTPFTLVITGGARGVDFLADSWALQQRIKTKMFPADWQKYGFSAGPIRNQQMLDEGKPDLVIAFPGGIGTADMVRRAKKAGVKVEEVQYDKR